MILDFFNRLFSRSTIKYFIAFYLFIAIFGAFLSFFSKDSGLSLKLGEGVDISLERKNKNELSRMEGVVDIVKRELRSIESALSINKNELNELLLNISEIDKDKINMLTKTSEKLTVFEKQITEFQEDLTNVKKALNPTASNEVLTVQRLGDKFELIVNRIDVLDKKISEIESKTEVTLRRNYDLAAAQVDRVVDMVKWVGVLLLPMIFTMLRDLFKENNHGGNKKASSLDKLAPSRINNS